MINVVVFDLDDTLFPERTFVRSGFLAVAAWLNQEYNISNFFEIAWSFYEQGSRGNIFNRFLENMGHDDQVELIQKMVQVYRGHKPEIELYEDARWAIQYFKQHQKRLGLITDGYLIAQQNKVEALGIQLNFDSIIYTDMFGKEHWKPSALPYLKLMDVVECLGEEIVYVGDNPLKDFITARKLNWKTIHITRSNGEYAQVPIDSAYAAEHHISSLYELTDVLSSL